MFTNKTIILILACSAFIPKICARRKIVCYYKGWYSYIGIQPEDFDASLCTHINYAFIGINNDGNLVPNDANLEIVQKLYQRVVDMKKRNANLKVLMSVGSDEGGAPKVFSAVAADPNKRKNLIKSAREYLTKYNMDGLDIYWNFPKDEDKHNYTALIREIRNDFSNTKWLLSGAVAANPSEGYNVTQLSQLYDYMNVLSFDFYNPWIKYTVHESPLFANPNETDYERQHLNLAVSIDNWIKAGVPINKLIMGLAFHGRSFMLSDPKDHGIHSWINGAGVDNGYPKYRMICFKYQNWTRAWIDMQKVPYKFNDNQWIGYEDEQSIGLKVDYINQKNLGGAMIWTIDSDDVKGACGTKQVLLRKVQGIK